MTSSTEVERQPRRVSRVQMAFMVMTLVAVQTLSGIWWVKGHHNVFERLMWHQWVFGPKASEEFDGPYSNISLGMDLWEHRAEVRYEANDLDLSVYIRTESDTAEYYDTTLWKSLFPTSIDVHYSEMIDSEFGYRLYVGYDSSTRTLTEGLRVLGEDGLSADVPDVGAYFAERGITAEFLRAKVDWLLNEKVLPDFLPSFPGWGYSEDHWGPVTVVRDEALS
jgi:hypothetical protein